jgi:hypothetical protein
MTCLEALQPRDDVPSASRMNVSMPVEIRHLVKQAAISTAAHQRDSLDDSAWVVRAVCEKLQREWECLGIGRPLPDLVRELSSHTLASARMEGVGLFEAARAVAAAA